MKESSEELFQNNTENSNLNDFHAVDMVNLVLMVIGMFTNTLCICIFAQKSSIKTKFNWYLLTLSIAELLFCSILLIDYFYRMMSVKPIFLHDLNIIYKIIMDFLTHTSDSYTIILTLILSIDRLYAITNPIKIKNFITYLHPINLIVSSIVILIAIKLPSTIICHLNESAQMQLCTIYCSFLLPLFINIAPAIAILILNVILIIKILKYKMIEPNLKSIRGGRTYTMAKPLPVSNKLRKSRYFIIVTMALWLLLTNIPYYALLAYQFGLTFYLVDLKTTIELQLATSVLFNLNHCINFFIYVCFHDVFRMNFNRLLSVLI